MEIKKEELEELYNSNTNDELCLMLGISYVTLIKLLKTAGIKLKGRGQKRKIKVVD